MARSPLSQALLAFCIMMLASGASSVVVMYWLGIPLTDELDASNPTVLVSMVLCSVFGLCLSIHLLARWFGWSYVRLRTPSSRHLGFAFAAVPLALSCSFLWSSLLEQWNDPVEPQMFVRAVLDTDSLGVVVFTATYAVLGAPILEEMLFRGFMLPAMVERLGTWLGMACNAFLFGLIHAADPWAIFPAAIIGLIACGLRVQTGSLGASIVFHSLNNLCALMLLAAGY